MNISLNLFITPFITLGLVLFGYFYFKKKVQEIRTYHRYLVVVGGLSFILNWVWEVAHAPLYEGFIYDLEHISFCGLAAVADLLMVYVLLFGFALIYENILWITKLNGRRILWLMLTGGAGAILVEIRHLAAGNWSYSDNMPLIPWVDVGLSPVLQFTLLPILVFWLINEFADRINA